MSAVPADAVVAPAGVLERQSESVAHCLRDNAYVHATATDDPEWAVSMQFGMNYAGGVFTRYLSPSKARELAAALNDAADFYDAETARIGGAP